MEYGYLVDVREMSEVEVVCNLLRIGVRESTIHRHFYKRGKGRQGFGTSTIKKMRQAMGLKAVSGRLPIDEYSCFDGFWKQPINQIHATIFWKIFSEVSGGGVEFWRAFLLA